MSVQNVQFEMQHTPFPAPDATPRFIVSVPDATYGRLGVFGYVKPATSVAVNCTEAGKYAAGCFMIDLTTNKIYQNTGTAASPSWTER